jgi:alkylated DNA nucleotide flippase Atl1
LSNSERSFLVNGPGSPPLTTMPAYATFYEKGRGNHSQDPCWTGDDLWTNCKGCWGYARCPSSGANSSFMSRKHHLPWHRVINSKGQISLQDDDLYQEQLLSLEAEGIKVGVNGTIDLQKYQYLND